MAKDAAYTESLNRLVDQFATLPGIGRRTAERLAFHVLKCSREEAMALSEAIAQVKINVRNCGVCYNLTETDPCTICGDDQRDRGKILVVEQPRDVINLEQTRSYRGLYHVLLGHLAPLEGVSPSDLTVEALFERAKMATADGRTVEIILGTNPNMEGDGTALYVAEGLAGIQGVEVSRLARGLPAGTQLEYANKAVLSDAITSRRPMK